MGFLELKDTIDSFVTPEPTNIRDCWDMVKEGITSILKESPTLTYLPEDVYSECVNGRAHLFTSPLGFVILRVVNDSFTGDNTLLIWLAYVYKKGQHNWLTHVKWFEEVAKNADCKFLEARSTVPELEPYFLDSGWCLDTKIFIKDIR